MCTIDASVACESDDTLNKNASGCDVQNDRGLVSLVPTETRKWMEFR